MLATSGRVNPDEYTDGFQHVLAPANNARHQREVDSSESVEVLLQLLIQMVILGFVHWWLPACICGH